MPNNEDKINPIKGVTLSKEVTYVTQHIKDQPIYLQYYLTKIIYNLKLYKYITKSYL